MYACVCRVFVYEERFNKSVFVSFKTKLTKSDNIFAYKLKNYYFCMSGLNV